MTKKFRELLQELKETTEKLEKDDLELEESLKIYEEGVKLSRLCHKKLQSAEQKVEFLQKDTDSKTNK